MLKGAVRSHLAPSPFPTISPSPSPPSLCHIQPTSLSLSPAALCFSRGPLCSSSVDGVDVDGEPFRSLGEYMSTLNGSRLANAMWFRGPVLPVLPVLQRHAKRADLEADAQRSSTSIPQHRSIARAPTHTHTHTHTLIYIYKLDTRTPAAHKRASGES